MFPGPSDPIIFALAALWLSVCVAACWKGGPAERLGGLILIVNTVVFSVAGYVLPSSAMGILLLVDDGLAALGLLAITLRYGSLWLGGCMLFYAAQFTLHSFYFVTERTPDRFHAIVNNVNFLGMVACLGVGTASTWIRRRRALAAQA